MARTLMGSMAWLLAASFSLLALAGDAGAGNRISGHVRFWDPTANEGRGAMVPAKRVVVEIEGDWFWRSDPHCLTDDAGFYDYTVDDAPRWWGDWDDVNIEPQALTPNLLRVTNTVVNPWPYFAETAGVDDVRPGRALVIDANIGQGPNPAAADRGNTLPMKFGFVRCHPNQVANGFKLHQIMLSHHDWLRGYAGWPASDFTPGTNVVFAAWSPSGVSYYNHLIDNINLVGQGADEAPQPQAYEAAKHEFSHAIHDHMSPVVCPIGLNVPSFHGLQVQSAVDCVAWTEGFAAFLKDVTDGRTNDFEATNPSWLMPHWTSTHEDCEGEVAAVLWDLHDGTGEEQVRHANPSIPAEIPQTFRDRVEDPRLVKIRAAVGSIRRFGHTPWTLQQFVATYLQDNPGETHALKAICYQRACLEGLPAENAPALGNVRATRSLNRLTVQGTVDEPDAEDRPFVRVRAYYRYDGSPYAELRVGRETPLAWNGAQARFSLSYTVPSAPGGGRAADADAARRTVYVVVDDDMEHRIAGVAAPGPDPNAPSGFVAIAGDQTRGLRAFLSGAGQGGPRLKVSPSMLANLNADGARRQSTLRASLLEQNTRSLAALRSLGQAQERAARTAAGLHKLVSLKGAMAGGTGKAMGKAALPKASEWLPGPGEKLSSPPPLLQSTVEGLATGEKVLDGSGLQADELAALDQARALADQALGELRQAKTAAPGHPAELRRLAAAYEFEKADAVESQGLLRDAAALEGGLLALAEDDQTEALLRNGVQALERIAGGAAPRAKLPTRKLPVVQPADGMDGLPLELLLNAATPLDASGATLVGFAMAPGGSSIFVRVRQKGVVVAQSKPEVVPGQGPQKFGVQHRIEGLATQTPYSAELVCSAPTGEQVGPAFEFQLNAPSPTDPEPVRPLKPGLLPTLKTLFKRPAKQGHALPPDGGKQPDAPPPGGGKRPYAPPPDLGEPPRLEVDLSQVYVQVEEAGAPWSTGCTAAGSAVVPGGSTLFFRVIIPATGAVVAQSAADTVPGEGLQKVSVKQGIEGLQPDTNYQLILVCQSPAGDKCSGPFGFWTTK